ncbi:MAG: hypothetical protein CME59_10695 [Halioglobus sp.]|mgnify:CR=1 FL=1|nr:hypothetical protein [Halioglobus sp.]|tara:strand:- start:1042 stop:1842 length:801 start_codon:yes stop_codon:yes gene_type:complete
MSDQETPTPQEGPATQESPQHQGAPQPTGFDLGTVIAQATQVITDPGGFYRGMAKGGGYSEPLIFALVMGVVSGLVFGVLSIIGLTGAGAAGLGAVIFMPIGLLIGSFIGAAILFVIWKLMGSPENYETAYRCVAYSTGILPVVTIIGIIPYLGTVVRVIWGIWLMIIASTEVHGRSQQTAMIVFGVLGLLGLFSGLSGEHASRNVQEAVERNAAELEQRMQSLENLGVNKDGEIDPEKMGRAMGEFFKGMEEAAREAEQAAQESN